MSVNVFPTKSNLMQTKRSLELARLGYELLDKKRNIMLREMLTMMDSVREIQSQIDAAFADAYLALQEANISLGQNTISHIADATAVDNDINLRTRSVMGIEIPEVMLEKTPERIFYGFHSTDAKLDVAYLKFRRVKELTAKAAAVENSVYRLAYAIKQAQKRANALKNIVIPRLDGTVRYITGYLEEKEREEFTTQKVVKNNL